MTKNIKTRIETLEGMTQADQYQGHDYNQVIKWEANDQIITRYYKDGVEITRGQYERENPYKPGDPIKVNMDWSEADNDQPK